MIRGEIEQKFQLLQKNIISGLEQTDGIGKFKFDAWQRPEGGGGVSSVIELGRILE